MKDMSNKNNANKIRMMFRTPYSLNLGQEIVLNTKPFKVTFIHSMRFVDARTIEAEFNIKEMYK
jgi:hypothetical protein